MSGTIALVGSGEWLPVMLDLERELLNNQNPVYVQLSTAAGQESPARLEHWKNLAQNQAKSLSVESRWLPVFDQESANNPELAEKIKGAGLIYLSGGDPTYLAETLRDSLVWKAIVKEWENGASLAGCSAGAMALTTWVPKMRIKIGKNNEDVKGLGLLPNIRVIPHFDRMLGWIPDIITRYLLNTPPGVTLVGIDEKTALVGGINSWIVNGEQSVWVLTHDGREEFKPGQSLVTN
ncbi:MAG: Type 1 glutamine amidotransferase-like domain-containing protein [Candidatus Nanopelagicales bacterium]|nr:Type 1 glutamine amidotransferase-like domain-containing protein [Candidatus Nanopelagicales bacterium]